MSGVHYSDVISVLSIHILLFFDWSVNMIVEILDRINKEA